MSIKKGQKVSEEIKVLQKKKKEYYRLAHQNFSAEFKVELNKGSHEGGLSHNENAILTQIIT